TDSQGHSQSKCMLMRCLEELHGVPSDSLPVQMWPLRCPREGAADAEAKVERQRKNRPN
ncbi:Transthyretin, partial [Dissostichus eleginoides]